MFLAALAQAADKDADADSTSNVGALAPQAKEEKATFKITPYGRDIMEKGSIVAQGTIQDLTAEVAHRHLAV